EGLLVTGHWTEGRARVWSLPEGRMTQRVDLGDQVHWQVTAGGRLMGVTVSEPGAGRRSFRLGSWSLRDGSHEELGEVDSTGLGAFDSTFDPAGDAWIHTKGDRVCSLPLPVVDAARGVELARHASDRIGVWDFRRARGFYSVDASGEVIVWDTVDGRSQPVHRLPRVDAGATRFLPEATGRWVVEDPGQQDRVRLWDPAGLAASRPFDLRRSTSWYFSNADFHPGLKWLAATTTGLTEVTFWPLETPRATVVEGYDTFARKPVVFTPDGSFLVTHWKQDRVRAWPMPGSARREPVDLLLPREFGVRQGLAVDPNGELVAAAGYGEGIFVLSMDGASRRQLESFPPNDLVEEIAFSPSGRLVAAASMISDTTPTLRVWDLETGSVRVFDQPGDSGVTGGYYTLYLAFADETRLYSSGANGLLLWDLERGSFSRVLEAAPGGFIDMLMAPDRRTMLTTRLGKDELHHEVRLHDLATGTVTRLTALDETYVSAVNEDGSTWVGQGADGLIRVGRTNGGDPHLLIGHEGSLKGLEISPDGRWIASSGDDKTLRLWPVPDLSKPPLHTLPHDELLAKLRSLTNLRAVRDPESSTGWKVEVGPFPGWETVPTW
ncbi:MAG TPA: WD40 repeat domain-containing protein, partial [Methylomirabilota bacterium]|nr:WD40 repeat domain-containing protein [Methylomirabilota bacterium]